MRSSALDAARDVHGADGAFELKARRRGDAEYHALIAARVGLLSAALLLGWLLLLLVLILLSLVLPLALILAFVLALILLVVAGAWACSMPPCFSCLSTGVLA